MTSTSAPAVSNIPALCQALAEQPLAQDQSEAIDLIRDFERAKAALEAAQARQTAVLEQLRIVEEADRGVSPKRRGKGLGAEIALARRESPTRGSQHLNLARALTTDLPHTLRALEAGRIREEHALAVERELDDGIEVVAEAADGRQAVEIIPKVAPDVVLMDMRMPVMSGLEALQVLSRDERLPPTIILTTFDDDQLVLAGLRAGAKGYLLKDVSLEQLVGAIRTVAEGGSLVQPAMTQRLLSGLEHMRNEFVSLDRPDPLTDRETEILRLMAGGFSNKEIANSLGVAEGTIKNHVSNILSKLGVRDRTRAVLKAFELKLV